MKPLGCLSYFNASLAKKGHIDKAERKTAGEIKEAIRKTRKKIS